MYKYNNNADTDIIILVNDLFPSSVLVGTHNPDCDYGSGVLSVDREGTNCPSGDGSITFGTENRALGVSSSVTGGAGNRANGDQLIEIQLTMSILKNDNSIYIASVVATYWSVSISMVYLNKVLMSNEGASINAPLFVTWFQCIVTTFICWGAGKCGQRQKTVSYSSAMNSSNDDDEENGKDSQTNKLLNSANGTPAPKPSFFSQFPPAEYTWDVARRIFPLSIIFVCMITFNNLCLKWVEVSFYNVARSFTIVFNVFFSFVLLGMTSSCKTVACLGIVIIGFLVGSIGEINFSVKGTIAGLASSLFVSLNSIFTKKLLPIVDDNHWRLTFYNNINASFLFIPLMAYFEKDIILTAVDSQLVSPTFWSAMCVAGFFGFSIGIVTVLQIKATSPLTHNISGTAKAAVQSMMAFYIWGNEATLLGVIGIFTVLGGSLLYTYVKMEENRKAQAAAAMEMANKENQSLTNNPSK